MGRPSNKQLRRERNLKLFGILSIFVLVGFLYYGVKNFFDLNGLKADVSDIHGAVFDTGKNVNSKMKILSGYSDVDINTKEQNIVTIKRSNTLSITPTEENIVSASTSELPIYMWFDNGTIYWYTQEERPKLNPDSSYMFDNLQKLESIPEMNNFDTSLVKHMDSLFGSCKSLSSIDLTNFNTSNVTDMTWMFNGCNSLLNLDLSSFDTRNVISMSFLFYDCYNLTSLNLSNFDGSKANKNKLEMFENCLKLQEIVLDNTVNMIESGAVLDIGKNVNNKMKLLAGNEVLDLNQTIDNNIIRIKRSDSLLITPNSENIISSPLSEKKIYAWFDNGTIYWYTEELRPKTNESNGYLFRDLINLETIDDLNQLNTTKTRYFSLMFYGCKSLKNVDLSNFNIENAEGINHMFYGCESLISLDLSSFNTSKVRQMSHMFYKCTNLKTIYVSDSFIVSQIQDGFSRDMFKDSVKLVGGAGTIYDVNHVDKEYARIDKSGTPGYFTLKENSDSSGGSSDQQSGGSDSSDSSTPSNNNANECKMILSSSVYTIDNNKLTINNVDKNHSVETIRNNITSDCGTIMVSENKVVLSTNKEIKEYTINRMWMPQTGQKVIKYTVIIAGIIAIITGLLIYKKKNDK